MENAHDGVPSERRDGYDLDLVDFLFVGQRNRIGNDQLGNNGILNALYSRVGQYGMGTGRIYAGRSHIFQGFGATAQGACRIDDVVDEDTGFAFNCL